MSIRTLMFDFDGTLHQTMLIYQEAFAEVCRWVRENGTPTRDYPPEEITQFLGVNLDEMWRKFQPTFTKEQRWAGAKQLGTYLDKRLCTGQAQLYPGTEQALSALKEEGYNLVLLSNCRIDYYQTARKRFQMDRWFSAYYCSEAYDGIPKQEIFRAIAAEQPGAFVMIGDRAGDLKVSEVHGLKSIGCLYGYGSREELKSATVFADSVSDIPALCRKLEQM
ncbi:MAG: HAD family hydrolase [Oscillospiraceae bacterium]|nr:HAD family hydrolase [Oscillospiraceae bacterium]